MEQRQLGLEQRGPSTWAVPHVPLQGLSPSCLLGCVTLNPCSPNPEEVAQPGRAVDREPGGSWGAQVGVQVCRGAVSSWQQ